MKIKGAYINYIMFFLTIIPIITDYNQDICHLSPVLINKCTTPITISFDSWRIGQPPTFHASDRIHNFVGSPAHLS